MAENKKAGAATVNFGDAFNALKQGSKVTRQAWFESNQGPQGPVRGPQAEQTGGEKKADEPRQWLQEVTAGSQVVIAIVGNGTISNYNVSNPDLNATDWIIL